jgi:hypothetical protein
LLIDYVNHHKEDIFKTIGYKVIPKQVTVSHRTRISVVTEHEKSQNSSQSIVPSHFKFQIGHINTKYFLTIHQNIASNRKHSEIHVRCMSNHIKQLASKIKDSIEHLLFKRAALATIMQVQTCSLKR